MLKNVKMKKHWSKVTIDQLDTRGINFDESVDFKQVVRDKSPIKAVRLTFKKDRINIIDEYINMHGKEKLSEYILDKLENDKDWKSDIALQQPA